MKYVNTITVHDIDTFVVGVQLRVRNMFIRSSLHFITHLILGSLARVSLAFLNLDDIDPASFVFRCQANCTYYDILNIDMRASVDEIKKNYRKLALLTHPDKAKTHYDQSSNHDDVSPEEAERHRIDTFLRIQKAYETLSDKENRRRYDETILDGTYESFHDASNAAEKFSNEAEVNFWDNNYETRPFSTFIKTPRFKMSFEASFAPMDIPDLIINLSMTLKETYEELKRDVQYFKKKLCSVCGGRGSSGGAYRTCSLCAGSGVATHILTLPLKNGGSYEQMTNTNCMACEGRGFIPSVEKCPACTGRGFAKEWSTLNVIVPLGSGTDGTSFRFEGLGNEGKDGRIGGVLLVLRVTMPDEWTVNKDTNDLLHTIKVPLRDLIHGCEKQITHPSGETLSLSINAVTNIADLFTGIDLTLPSKGLVLKDGGRTNCIVHCDTDWSGLDLETLKELLLEIGLVEGDPLLQRLESLFFQQDDFEENYKETLSADVTL